MSTPPADHFLDHRAIAWLLFVLSLWGCATGDLRFAPRSDPDVLTALRVLPEGAEAPRMLSDVIARSPRSPGGSFQEALLDGVVTARGEVKVIEIAKATAPAYGSECVRAVRRWRYVPARLADGTPVGVHTRFSCSVRTP